MIPKTGAGAYALAAAASAPAPVSRSSTVHVVRRGDTLWELSRRYGVSIAEIMEWNGLGSRTIRPGQRLRVRPPESTGGGRVITYRVQRGDTLWAIARRYSVSPEDLMRWNDLGPDDVIRPGDAVKVLLP